MTMRFLHTLSPLLNNHHFSLPSLLFSTQIKLLPPFSLTMDSTSQNPQTPLPPLNKLADPLHYLHTFIPIIHTLSENPRNFTALSALDSLLSQTHSLDSSTSVIVVDYLSQIKRLGRAKAVLLDLKGKGKVCDQFLYSLVADCLVKKGNIDEVEIVWNELCGCTTNKIDISDYVIYLCRFGGVLEIKDICERILKGRRVLDKQSYVALIGALCGENEGLLAKRVVKEMYDKRLRVDDLSYYVMFRCFCRNGEVDEADLILRKLVRRGFCIDVCIYGNFLYALCESGKFREASKLFRKLVKRDFSGGDKKVEFLKEGRRVIFQLDSEGRVPEIMAYEAYFRSLCSAGRLDEAEVLLKKMMKSRTLPELCVYGSFIRALFLASRDEDAIRFFNVERKKGLVRVDGIGRFVIAGLCEKGKLDESVKIFDEIVSRGGFTTCALVCNNILESYWNEGRVMEAECFFGKMKNGNYASPDISTYKIMLNGYCVQGNVNKALLIFEEVLNSKIVVNVTLYEMIIKALCGCGRLKEALKYLNDMIESGNMVSGMKWKRFFYATFTAVELGTSDGV